VSAQDAFVAAQVCVELCCSCSVRSRCVCSGAGVWCSVVQCGAGWCSVVQFVAAPLSLLNVFMAA